MGRQPMVKKTTPRASKSPKPAGPPQEASRAEVAAAVDRVIARNQEALTGLAKK